MITTKAVLKGDPQGLDLKDCSCAVTISVGQKYHEGEQLSAVLKEVGAEFKAVEIILGCSLQRITKASEKRSSDPEAFHKEAVKDGDEWLTRNIKCIKNSLGDKLGKIRRWDDFLNNKEYAAKRKIIEKLYEDDKEFRTSVDQSATQYAERHTKLSEEKEQNVLLMRLSREYVLEESAVFLLWKPLGINFIVYPKKLYPTIYYLILKFIHNDQPHLLIPLRADFKKNNKKAKCEEKSLQQSIIQNGAGFSQQNVSICLSSKQLYALVNDMNCTLVTVASKHLPPKALPAFIASILKGGLESFVSSVHVTEAETSTGSSPVCGARSLANSSSYFVSASSSSSSSSSSTSPVAHFLSANTTSPEQPSLERSRSQPRSPS